MANDDDSRRDDTNPGRREYDLTRMDQVWIWLHDDMEVGNIGRAQRRAFPMMMQAYMDGSKSAARHSKWFTAGITVGPTVVALVAIIMGHFWK